MFSIDAKYLIQLHLYYRTISQRNIKRRFPKSILHAHFHSGKLSALFYGYLVCPPLSKPVSNSPFLAEIT
jgi:hypothetical protein